MNSVEFNKKLRRQLEIHEGVSYSVYIDPVGVPTVGIGFNLDRPDAPRILKSIGLDYEAVRSGLSHLTRDDVSRLLDVCIREALSEVKKYIKNFDSLSSVRKRVLIDMMFNLGSSRFSKFEKFIEYVNSGQFPRASLSMARSLWFRQVGLRGIRLSAMMLTDIDLIPEK